MTDMLLASISFHPDYAGPALRFKRYEPGLRQRGVRMRVFAGRWGENTGPDRAPGELLTPEEVEGIPVQRVVIDADIHPARRQWTYDRVLTEHCGEATSRPDLVQHLSLNPYSFPWFFRLRRLGIPQVYVHTMAGELCFRGLLGDLKRRLRVLPMNLMERIVVSSAVMGKELEAAGVRTPITVIPNGVDLERFRPSTVDQRRDLRCKLGLDLEAEVIVFVGGYLIHRKGVDLLAEAWRRLAPRRPDSRLVLVGPEISALHPSGPQREFLTEVRRSLEASGAQDRVVFTGRVANVEEYLRAADVFVFPSRQEGMPNVVAEAFACGVASVLAPFTGFPEEFGRAGSEYVAVDHDARYIAEALDRLLEDVDRRERLGARARAWAEGHLDVESSLDSFAQLYAELTPVPTGSPIA